jgi:putative PIN family toxin of toxin-antitoxin system
VRAVVDTNVWVSAVLNESGLPARVLEAYLAGRFTLVVSEPMLEEMAEVMARPRLVRRHGRSPERIAILSSYSPRTSRSCPGEWYGSGLPRSG